jgi:hypothetical protein
MQIIRKNRLEGRLTDKSTSSSANSRKEQCHNSDIEVAPMPKFVNMAKEPIQGTPDKPKTKSKKQKVKKVVCN